MKMKLCILLFLTCVVFNMPVECSDIDYKSLEGLKSINNLMYVYINVSGDEPFNLNEDTIKNIIRKRLQDTNILVDSSNKANAYFNVYVEGKSTGGGGADYIVKIHLISRVTSPFKQDSKISAIIWITEICQSEAMSYDPDKKQLVRVKGNINERVYDTIGEAINKFLKDYNKAIIN